MLGIFIYNLHYVHLKSYIELPVRPQKGTQIFLSSTITFESGPSFLQLSSCSIDAASCFGCRFCSTDQFSLGSSLELFDWVFLWAMKNNKADWSQQLSCKQNQCVIGRLLEQLSGYSWTNSNSKNSFGACIHSFWPILHYYIYSLSHHVEYLFQSG